VETFSSLDLKMIAAKVAANEATHFSFFDAAAGGHADLDGIRNVCRCGTYPRIREAITAGAATM
jgi:hypothetical protein